MHIVHHVHVYDVFVEHDVHDESGTRVPRTIRIGPDADKLIVRWAADEQRSPSAMYRILVEEAVKARMKNGRR